MNNAPQTEASIDPRATRDSIFALVLEGKHHFADVGGLPDVRSFLKEYSDQLRRILKQRWIELLPESPQPLVVNILVNPELLFCTRDAMHGQYSRYFRPVYLDAEAICLDQGGSSNDATARAIVNLHKTFDSHYEDDDLEARQILSLNDIESFLLKKRITTPLPPANTVISFSREEDVVVCDGRQDYLPTITAALDYVMMQNAACKFRRYRDLVTADLGSYHHVTIGSDENWVGRVYLAFRDGEAGTCNPEWIARVKGFAFDVLSPVALAGSFIRNPGVIAMLGDVHELLSLSNETRRRHSLTLERFFGSVTQSNRKKFPAIDYINTTSISAHRRDSSHPLRLTGDHFLTSACWCTHNKDEMLTHALEHCEISPGVGSAFLADISDILRSIRVFNDLPPDTLAFLAQSLAFGLTGHEDRPKLLEAHLKQRSILADWMSTCRTEAPGKVTKSLRPFVQSLLLMVGNQTMVRSDAESLDIVLESGPALRKLEADGHHIEMTVEYKVSGNLSATEERTLDSRYRDTLHVNNNTLLLCFGKQFLDDFRMCITTVMGGKTLSSVHRWSEPKPSNEGTITYAFKFLR
jgi:hypothetical protein